MAEPDPVRAQYRRLARVYDSRWAHYIESTVSETLRRMDFARGQCVLDVGCGTGVLLKEILGIAPGLRVTGVDLTPAMLKVAAGRLPSGTPLVAADAARLPFKSRSFDAVVSTSSLHYWPDPVAGLREIARVLRAGGRVFVTDWCDDYIACWICDRALRLLDPAHRRAYGQKECRDFLVRAGFQIEALERYKIDWLWGLMTARAVSSGGQKSCGTGRGDQVANESS